MAGETQLNWPFVEAGDGMRWVVEGARYDIYPRGHLRKGWRLVYFAPGAEYGETLGTESWHRWKLVERARDHAVVHHRDSIEKMSNYAQRRILGGFNGPKLVES